MKKFLKINLFAVIAGLFALTLVACIENDPIEYPPVNLADIPGNYSGKIVINHNELNKESLILHTTTADSIKFAEFPLLEIVKSIEPNDTDATEIVNKIGKIPYGFGYEATVRQDYGGAEMKLHPQPLELIIPTKSGDKKALITFSAADAGFYSSTEKAMAIRVKVDEISVDGVKVDPFNVITYTLPYSTQTK